MREASERLKLGESLRDIVVRALLLGLPLEMLYYWNTAAEWRHEAIRFPFRVRIWEACLPIDHYFFLDWLLSSFTLFLILSLFSIPRAIPGRTRKGAGRFPQISNN